MTKDKSVRGAQASLITAMLIFGTIGIFRRHIPLPSGVLAAARGFIGAAFLILTMRLRGERPDGAAIRANIKTLVLSGVCIGFNWILLFEAYRYTSVAVATLCYYMAPIFVILASPLVLGERIGVKKAVCVAAAIAGMALVSGVASAGFSGAGELRGVVLGLGAAVLYASVILLNKCLGDISAYDRTLVQLVIAGAVLLPYCALTGELSGLHVTLLAGTMLIIVGVVHTGFAYALYFGSMKSLPAQTVALLSYIDPIVAIVLSALVLGERMDAWQMIGAVLVLCATIASELPTRQKHHTN